MAPSADELQSLLALGVSRETISALQLYSDLLVRWQSIKNLVGQSTLQHIWSRHFLDSLQLVALSGNATKWIDLGSGSGFPGMVVAIALRDVVGARIDLVESDKRKCAFLRAVSRETGAPTHVHSERIEIALPRLETPQIVTARALAPLDQLLTWAGPMIEGGATGLFLKGQDIDRELTNSSKSSKFKIMLSPSRMDPKGKIVVVRRQTSTG